MPKQTRLSTADSGVYFVELADEDQSFFIRYKQNGKSYEERAGRSSQGWNAEKASCLRKERLSSVNPLGRYSWKGKGELEGDYNWTFSKIFEAYLRLRPDLKGRENDVYRFRNYLKVDFGDITPSEVISGDIERLTHKLHNQQLKPATVKHVLELLRRLANFAFKKKFCPGLNFKIQMPSVENQKTEKLTQEQLEKLMRVLDEEPDKQVSNIVRLVLYTGLRRGEVFSLKWKDIDFYEKTIILRSKKKEKYVVLPMNEMAEKVLAEHAQSGAKSEFVFPSRGGKKRTECKRPLLRIKKNARLSDDFRLLQGLRHVYASMLASSGEVDMETLQTLLTHKSPLMTQRYAHLREDALRNSYEEIVQEQISHTQDSFEEKPITYDDESTDQYQKVSVEEDLSELADQSRADDHRFETNEENERLEDGLESIEAEFKEHETEYIEVNVDPIKMEVDMDEIVSAEELAEAVADWQHTEFKDQSVDAYYSAETNEENEHLEEERIAVEVEINEQETEYLEVDLDPIKMEVDLDEIVSAEEFTEIVEELHEYQTKPENKESDYIDELTAEIIETEEILEVEIDQEVYRAFAEENLEKDYVIGPTENLILKEDLFTKTEAMEEISEISEEHVESIYTGETSEEEIPSEEIDFQIKEEEVIFNNYSENKDPDTHEVSDESIEASEGEFSEKDNVTQINDYKSENSDIGYSVIEQQEYKATETLLDNLVKEKEIDYSNRNAELFDFIAEAENLKNTSNSNETINDELRVEDHSLVQNFTSEDDADEKLVEKMKAVSKNGENSVHTSKNTEGLNLSVAKSGKYNVSRSTTYKNPERLNSLKDVKIDLELNPENKESVINSASATRSSISELKKELMSFSDLIKSTPTKLKSSVEPQNP